ncbi:MAG: short-chain dehydrogenase/reductase, partial [Myxococcota bacterium]
AVAPGVFRTDWNARSMHESPETIPDYAPTVGERRKLLRTTPEGFGGDARKVGDALVMLSRLEDPPLRLLLGADAIAAARGKIADLTSTIDAWEAYGVAAGETGSSE